ncbi:MAG: hypothetical protein JXL80_03760 [Planctomycetes bacterium]|nr:hypothetical protein [Planctomycetota bacterium]
MDLGGLMTSVGIVLAVFALARPAQRRSVCLFVPLWISVGLVIPVGLLICLDVLDHWKIDVPLWLSFSFRTVAFFAPITALLLAVVFWYRATLSKNKDSRLRQFLLSCLRDHDMDEAARILGKNHGRLPTILTRDTADVVFDRYFIRELVAARTWIHLELLANDELLKALPNIRRAVDRTLRELLFAGESPLRTAALWQEGGDETLHCAENEKRLLDQTLLNPAWYHRCGAGYPLVVAACERIDSGELDATYNQPDRLYVAHQGITRRSMCPVFLAEKTIAHMLMAEIQQNSGTTEDTHRDAADLWDIFRACQAHSRYSPQTWDEPSGCGDYPTPFGFLLAEILEDYYRICWEAREKSHSPEKPPSELLGPAIRMWANCVMRMARAEQHVSPAFRATSAATLLEMLLEWRHFENRTKPNGEHPWSRMFLENLTDAIRIGATESYEYVTEILDNKMDLAKSHVSSSREWLRQELKLRLRGHGLTED